MVEGVVARGDAMKGGAPREDASRGDAPRGDVPRGDALKEVTRSGPGRVLIAVYGVFALAATSRSAVQVATRFDQAPLAYLLSALAAVVYLVATAGLARGRRRTAVAACAFELVGVLAVGTLSLADPAAFPDETVWSGYGRGYLFIPLVLPVVGLLWLRRRAATGRAGAPR